MSMLEMIPEAYKSFSTLSASCFKVYKSGAPVKPKIVTLSDILLVFTLFIMGFSAPCGKELIELIALSTSLYTSSISASSKPLIVMAEIFSDEVELISSIPSIPLNDCSILMVTPSSISSGDAPGYITLIFIIRGSVSGKKDFLMVNKLYTPNITTTTITAFAQM